MGIIVKCKRRAKFVAQKNLDFQHRNGVFNFDCKSGSFKEQQNSCAAFICNDMRTYLFSLFKMFCLE